MQSILVVKTDHKRLPAEDGLPLDLLHIDKLTHGLLTQAIYRGFVKDMSSELLCLRPEQGPLDVVLIGSEIKQSELSKAKKGFPEVKNSYWWGEFSAAELSSARKILPKLKKWEEKRA